MKQLDLFQNLAAPEADQLTSPGEPGGAVMPTGVERPSRRTDPNAVTPRKRCGVSARKGSETPEFAGLDIPAPALSPEVEDELGLTEVSVTPQVATLADALAWYDDAVCDHPRRANIRSAFRTIGRVLNLPLDAVPASPAQLRPLFDKATPGRAGIKPTNWTQVKSTARGGLRGLGVSIAAARDMTPLDPAWERLSGELPEPRFQIGMSRLLRFLTRKGVTPEQVTTADFEAFEHELLASSLDRNAEGAYRQAMRLWNKASATVAGWPQVTARSESDPRRYSLNWDRFPASFVREVNAFLDAKSSTDPLADDFVRSTRAATTDERRKSLRQTASALVLSGALPLEAVTSLGVLTDLENARAAVRYLRDERQGGEVTESHLNVVWLLRTIARHWLKDEQGADKLGTLLTALRAHLGNGSGGLTPKNQDRLRQFNIPAHVEALIGLPSRVLRSVRAAPEPRHRHSVRLMQALQVGLLTFVPIRSKNLASLQLGTNLIDIGKGTRRVVRIHLPASQTKTYRDHDAPVPAHLYPLLDLWLASIASASAAARAPICSPIPGAN